MSRIISTSSAGSIHRGPSPSWKNFRTSTRAPTPRTKIRPFPSVFAMGCRCPGRGSQRGDGVNDEGSTLHETYFGSDDLTSYEFRFHGANAGATKRRRRIESRDQEVGGGSDALPGSRLHQRLLDTRQAHRRLVWPTNQNGEQRR